MKKILIIISVVLLVLIFIECGPSGEDDDNQDNLLPILTRITPSSKVSNMPIFTLAAIGTNFNYSSTIIFNNSEKQTTFVSSTELNCQITPDDINMGTNSSSMQSSNSISNIWNDNEFVYVQVMVHNTSPVNAFSNSVVFTIHSNFTFRTPIIISSGPGKEREPVIDVSDAGDINIAMENCTADNDFCSVKFIRSTDRGESWGNLIDVYNRSGASHSPSIALDAEGNINIVFEDNKAIYFTFSTDNGTSWSEAEKISDEGEIASQPEIVVDGMDGIDVVWNDTTEFSVCPRVDFARSTDKGMSWIGPVNIFNSLYIEGGLYGSPSIGVDGAGAISVTWTSRYSTKYTQIFFNRSADLGASWDMADSIAWISRSPAVAVDSAGNINVAFASAYIPNAYDIRFKRSTDAGVTWSGYIDIADCRNKGSAHSPAIAVDSAGNINVVYYFGNWYSSEDTSGIYFSRSTDNGTTWSEGVRLSDQAESYHIDIDVDDSGNIYVVWDGGYFGGVYFSGSTRN